MSVTYNNPSLWDVLDNYADVRDELDDVLQSFSMAQYELQCAMDDINGELEAIQGHLAECDRVFRRYKCKAPVRVPEITPAVAGGDDTEEGLPFPM